MQSGGGQGGGGPPRGWPGAPPPQTTSPSSYGAPQPPTQQPYPQVPQQAAQPPYGQPGYPLPPPAQPQAWPGAPQQAPGPQAPWQGQPQAYPAQHPGWQGQPPPTPGQAPYAQPQPGSYGQPQHPYGAPPGGFAQPGAIPGAQAIPTNPVAALPWENRAQIGTVNAFVKTVERAFKPNEYFDAVGLSDDPAPAVKFGVLCWVVGATARALLRFVFGGILEIGFFGGHVVSFTGDVVFLVWELIVAAIMGFLAVHLFATIEHAVLENQKGVTRPKVATLRVAGYAGVAGLLFFVPGYIGNLVWIATVLLNMVGLQRVQRTDQTKALVSAFVASFAIGAIYVFVLGMVVTLIIGAIFIAI